jgi:MFS family permease
MRLPGFLSFTATYGLSGFGYSITATFLVAMVHAVRSTGSLQTLTWLCVGLTAVPSVWLWGKVGRRLGERRAMAIAAVLLALGNTSAVLSPTAPGLLISAVLLGGTFMGITALGFTATQHLSPERRRSAGALLTAAFGLGQIVGPVLAGVVADRTGSFAAPTLVATIALLAGAVLLVAVGPRHKAPTAIIVPVE